VRELRARAGQFLGEGEFNAWWEEREEGQRGHEIWKERQRELRKMKRDAERWAERVEKEEKEERAKGQAYRPVRQVEETYIDDYEYNNDY
jgi:hypothetical protein